MFVLQASSYEIYSVKRGQATLYTLHNHGYINSFPYDKILDWSKLKAFADNKINVKEKSKFGLGREENIEGKGENAGYLHFLLFTPCFLKAFLSGSLCSKELKSILVKQQTALPL